MNDEASKSRGPLGREPSLSLSLALNPLAVMESSAFEDWASKSSTQVSFTDPISGLNQRHPYNHQYSVPLPAQSQSTRASRTHYYPPSPTSQASAASPTNTYTTRKHDTNLMSFSDSPSRHQDLLIPRIKLTRQLALLTRLTRLRPRALDLLPATSRTPAPVSSLPQRGRLSPEMTNALQERLAPLPFPVTLSANSAVFLRCLDVGGIAASLLMSEGKVGDC